ncbi:hypothetical protein JR316_0005315 [Psilocybe cubensis]|uniref:Uncharacterized protein n=2 Tax=Psilocybe cubensis TaxID=181762 RepID=A0A8H7XMI7_PSICU|nr:hypothetical protein JR316_0005315 [Psilocybe cubensis]KAH9483211.1 hypothetical protein JR316_0005315 [Psilocybe cubensis]
MDSMNISSPPKSSEPMPVDAIVDGENGVEFGSIRLSEGDDGIQTEQGVDIGLLNGSQADGGRQTGQGVDFGLFSGSQGDGGREGAPNDPTLAYQRNQALLAMAQRIYAENEAIACPIRASSNSDGNDNIADHLRSYQCVAIDAAALARAGGLKGIMELNDETAIQVMRDIEITF